MQSAKIVRLLIETRAVESDKSDEAKSLKKKEKSDFISYQTFGRKSTSLMEMS